MPATCPVCKRQHTESATPLTRKTQRGKIQVIAHRLKCLDCGHVDRLAAFAGSLSLNQVGGPPDLARYDPEDD